MNQKPLIQGVLTPLLGCLLLGGTTTPALIINPIWDSSITSDVNAATIQSSINAVIAIY